MFRRFAGNIPTGADILFNIHASQLAVMLDQAWELRLKGGQPLGDPRNRSALPGLPGAGAGLPNFGIVQPNPKISTVGWENLIYAYLIENTRIFEIFRKVIYEYTHGEHLGPPLLGSEQWIRNTEELLYRDPATFFLSAGPSHIRPDLGAVRRNAYHRMFGMDLNHGVGDSKEQAYVRSKIHNSDFINSFEGLLREVWVGIENVGNFSGVNPTDDATIFDLAERLKNMLLSRRVTGSLAIEEYNAISTMSWLHLTVEYDSPIVRSMRAEAESPEERLFKIAERVQLAAHGKARSFFQLADPTSRILNYLESGAVTPATASTLYLRAGGNTIPDDMRQIITHWSIVTGRDMKTRVITVSPLRQYTNGASKAEVPASIGMN